MFRPQSPKMWEPSNPEHSLVDALTEEMHMNESPEIYYWVNKKSNEIDTERQVIDANADNYLDELDKVYGEKSSGDGLLLFREPVRVYGKVDVEPIIQELLRLGLVQTEQLDLYMNIAHAHQKLKQPPNGGDVFRVTYLIRDQHGDLKDHYVYYKVASINPVDLYNFQYINYQINAEQTNMMNVPDEIKNFFIENKF